MARWLRAALLAALASTSLACSDDTRTVVVPEGCNPIAAEHDCMLPFPSDFYRPDGMVVLPDATKLVTSKGVRLDPFELHPADGFSPGHQIIALFPGGLDDAPLIGATDDLTASLEASSPTILLDADTGERVLHMAELDPRAEEDARRALVLRPLERLEEEHRYVVAIRGLDGLDGAPLPAPAGFAALRDGVESDAPALEALRARYESEVFAPLTSAGVARDALILAWDFTVRSRDDVAGDMFAVRDQTLAAASAEAPTLTVVSVEDDVDEHTARRIELTVRTPLFLDAPGPNSRLNRDASGAVAESGFTEVPMTVWIPRSVAQRAPGSPPARLMQFGHGFFGARSEVNSFIDSLADELGFVVIASDWWGMSEDDQLPVIDNLVAAPSEALLFTDRVHQSMANLLTAAEAGVTTLPALAEITSMQVDDAPLFASDAIYYYGISQGHILGGTYLSLSPRIDHAVLSVGGSDFTFMMFRARPFLAFLLFVSQVTPDFLDQQKFVSLAQMGFDRVDPLTYAPILRDEQRVLMQIGIGDDQVPNLASHLHARAMGIPHLQPAPRPIPAMPTTDGPAARALVEFDFGIDPLPGLEAIPPTTETEAHEGVRRLAAAKAQLDALLRPGGEIVNTCDGPCDPE